VLVLVVAAVGLRRVHTNLRELLSAKLGIISAQAKASGVALRAKVADDVPTVVDLDSEKIAWAITMLVGNALRYLQSTSRRVAGKLVAVRVSFDAAASAIAISVDDDGPGIPEDTVRRLFDRDTLNVRGSGLALLVVRDILAAHGGTVDVRSSTDPIAHGTRIRLVLPVRSPDHRTTSPEPAAPEHATRSF
jgi:signal transduction histidine kinase